MLFLVKERPGHIIVQGAKPVPGSLILAAFSDTKGNDIPLHLVFQGFRNCHHMCSINCQVLIANDLCGPEGFLEVVNRLKPATGGVVRSPALKKEKYPG